MKLNEKTPEDNVKLIAQLEKESVDIKYEFEKLIKETTNCLENVGNLKDFFKVYYRLTELPKYFEHTDTIPDVMIRLSGEKYWTFFSYQFLASIINTLCRNRAITVELKNYESSFRDYCQHKICEMPANLIKCATAPSIDPNSLLLVKFDDTFSLSDPLNKVEKIQHEIEQLLDTDLNVIDLSVDGGIVLTFRYFKQFEDICSMIIEKMNEFAVFGVKWLQRGTFKWKMEEQYSSSQGIALYWDLAMYPNGGTLLEVYT